MKMVVKLVLNFLLVMLSGASNITSRSKLTESGRGGQRSWIDLVYPEVGALHRALTENHPSPFRHHFREGDMGDS